MSSLARWSYANTARVQPFLGADDFNGGATYGEEYEIACTWRAQSSRERQIVAADGQEYVTSNTIFTEDPRPKYLDRIALGDSLDFEEIRKVGTFDRSPFGEADSPDFELMT